MQRGLFDRRMVAGGRFVHPKQMPLIPHALPHNPRALLSDGAIKLARQPYQGEASCTPIWRSPPIGEEADHVDWSQMCGEKKRVARLRFLKYRGLAEAGCVFRLAYRLRLNFRKHFNSRGGSR